MRSDIARLPVQRQLAEFRDALSRNEVLLDVLNRAATLDLPGWYLTAGCLLQTVWNVVTHRPPMHGIQDYDLFYFDDRDVSWDAENRVIQRGRGKFRDTNVEIRNEARVHLWYEQKFGTPCAPHTSTESAIESFAATTCCLGVRLDTDGRWNVYAPHGSSDVFALVVRPNPVVAPKSLYELKARRWQEFWPELTVLPWPELTAE